MRIRVRKQAYDKAHPEEKKARKRRWYHKHKTKDNSRWRSRNSEKYREWERAYSKKKTAALRAIKELGIEI